MVVTNPYEDSPDSGRSTIDQERKGTQYRFGSIDLPRTEDGLYTPSNSRRYLLPLSLASNLLLFIIILFQLAHPCFFSARNCVYDKRGGSQEQVKEVMDMAEVKGELMGDVNKIVPEFPTQEVVFMNDSRYSNENMFKNEKEFNTILSTWENDMPRGTDLDALQATQIWRGMLRIASTIYDSQCIALPITRSDFNIITMFSYPLKTASLALLVLEGASTLSIDGHQLVRREIVHAEQIPDALEVSETPAVRIPRPKHSAPGVSTIRGADEQGQGENANCDPSGETSYGLTSADSRSLASPPFDDGWDTKIMSLRCYAMQDFSMRETVFERSDSNPLEEEDKENLEISKVDTTLPRRSLPNQVHPPPSSQGLSPD
ncbi:hypothetical protein BLS_006189 [Venturia inaequalis]|uniref:Uncharacterized protein n=2 Tax=Venturia inaequalis TaxID=5025 RepID=A0A8H3YSH1_VENIN|nr:hypothetical protein BLS_006189 [Venturia inaequalis]